MKAYKVTCLILPLNGDIQDADDIIVTLGNLRHPEFLDVMKVEEVEIGEWDDESPLNQESTKHAEFERLFPTS